MRDCPSPVTFGWEPLVSSIRITFTKSRVVIDNFRLFGRHTLPDLFKVLASRDTRSIRRSLFSISDGNVVPHSLPLSPPIL